MELGKWVGALTSQVDILHNKSQEYPTPTYNMFKIIYIIIFLLIIQKDVKYIYIYR